MKLGLGTAQFGMIYGAFNRHGQTTIHEVVQILEVCAGFKVHVIDTAASYGESEQVIGQCLPRAHHFKIVTKTPYFKVSKITEQQASDLEKTFELSLRKLNQSSIYGLLIHNPENLLAENSVLLWETMQVLKQQGRVVKIGVSVYTRHQIDQLLARYNLDLLQVPINVFDQRLIEAGYLKRLKERGIEIHARSPFLQGLLVTDLVHLHPYFDFIKDHIIAYRKYIETYGLSPTQAAIGFLKNMDEIDTIIVGVETIDQLKQIIADFHKESPVINFSRFAIHEEKVINPALWKL
jgi:aryl-alcohol dehydrogenase-like predicted oxidoreductase